MSQNRGGADCLHSESLVPPAVRDYKLRVVVITLLPCCTYQFSSLHDATIISKFVVEFLLSGSTADSSPDADVVALMKNRRTQSAARPWLGAAAASAGRDEVMAPDQGLHCSVSSVLFQMFVRRVLVTCVHH